jgi:hypothetical protein
MKHLRSSSSSSATVAHDLVTVNIRVEIHGSEVDHIEHSLASYLLKASFHLRFHMFNNFSKHLVNLPLTQAT